MAYSYSVYATKNVANVSTDRILKLLPIEQDISKTGKPHVHTKTLLSVEIHAVQESGLWRIEYKGIGGERGAGFLPEALKQRWTNFNQLRKFLDAYFATRNLRIEEIVA